MPVSATQALRKAAETGEPLPLPPAMARVVQAGGAFRRGHEVMIVGLPNAGKSAFAQWIAAQTNVPTLYFSADQDEFTASTRLAASLTGTPVGQIATALNIGEGTYFEQVLNQSNLKFCFDPTPSLEDIQLELDAYVDTWDDYPHMIVVDNLIDIDIAGPPDADHYILSELNALARKTRACVVVLAHGSEVTTKDNHPPRMKDIHNKVSKKPQLILTVNLDDTNNNFLVCVVKTREGKADRNALRPIVMGRDFSIMQFYATPAMAWGQEYQ